MFLLNRFKTQVAQDTKSKFVTICKFDRISRYRLNNVSCLKNNGLTKNEAKIMHGNDDNNTVVLLALQKSTL